MRKILDQYDGMTETFHKDPMTGQMGIQTTFDVGQTFDANTEQRNNSSNGWQGDMHHVARIDMGIIEMWRNEMKAAGHTDCDPLSRDNRSWLAAKLNSSEFLKLRTKTGRIN